MLSKQFLANTVQHKMIHRYTWRRGIQDELKGFINYVAVNKRLKADVMGAKVVRGMFEGLDDCAILNENKN